MNAVQLGLTLGLLGLLATPLPACRRIEDGPGTSKGQRVTLIYTSNVDGELEPCG